MYVYRYLYSYVLTEENGNGKEMKNLHTIEMKLSKLSTRIR